MKIINQIISLFVGGLFIFSGAIKLNDPLGTEIKLEEYFEVFATDKTELGLAALSGLWHFLAPYSLFLSVTLCVLEIVLGIALLIKFRPNATLWALLLTIIFFTFLTFYSAYFNKVTDCGCFGDFIKLKPWSSFTKDVVLLILIGFLFFQRKPFGNPKQPAWKLWVFVGSTVFCVAGAFHVIYHLPIFDFLPYKVGANIPAQMKPSAELKFGKEVYTYTNLKTQKDEQFEKWEKKLSDTTEYKFKSYEKPLLNPEAQAKITDYNVTSADGSDFTEETFKDDKLLIIIQDVKKTNVEAVKKIAVLAKSLEKTKIKPIILTASDGATFENFRHELQLAVPYYFVDKSVLKTMVRANPGLIWLRAGTVLNKWHYFDMPKVEDFKL